MNMNFFRGKDARTFFAPYHNRLKEEVTRLSDAEIVSCNFQEWADYLSDKYYVAPISLFETNIERTL